jgi:hypothetical protein
LNVTNDSNTDDGRRCNHWWTAENLRRRRDQSTRDLKSIPGMVFFTVGLNILNLHQTANSLEHIQAKVLACLYMARLAWLPSSYQYAREACRALPLLFSRLRPHEVSDQLHQILTHTLTACLQLESDLARQLNTPSFISNLEPDCRLALESLGDQIELPPEPASPYQLYKDELRKLLCEFRHSVARTDSGSEPPTDAIKSFSDRARQCYHRLSLRHLSKSAPDLESGVMDLYAHAQLEDALFEINLPAIVYTAASTLPISNDLKMAAMDGLEAASNGIKICHDENGHVARACIPGFYHG